MANANNYSLKVEKTIAKPQAEVFRAISEGRLFANCSADQESMKIDFKVGGQYSLSWVSYGMKNRGEFLEIQPHSRIVFTWCQDYESNPTPDTKVEVTLKDLGGKTSVLITHSGFADKENCDAHTGGWSSGLEDLGKEMAEGTLRLTRKYPVSPEELYSIIIASPSKLGPMEIIEKSANQKIVLQCPEKTRATLSLEADDDDQNVSWLELVHEGLMTEAAQKKVRAHWDQALKQFK